jgi:hypothetical protein
MTRRVTLIVGSAAAVIAMVVVALAIAFPGPTPGQVAARSAGDRLIAEIRALPAGVEVNLADALDEPWERAVLMEAYMPGDEMNQRLGFDWYAADHLAGSDESQQTMAFVNGTTVVAEVLLSPDTFRLDVSIGSFGRADSKFVTSRDPSGLVVLHK